MSPRFFRRSSTSDRSSAFTVSLGCARDSAAAGHEQMRVLGHDDMLVVQLQRLVEAFTQLGKVLQRAAEKGHVTADRAAARQAGDGLGHNRLEDRGGDVLGAGASLRRGCTSVLANTPQRLAMG